LSWMSSHGCHDVISSMTPAGSNIGGRY